MTNGATTSLRVRFYRTQFVVLRGLVSPCNLWLPTDPNRVAVPVGKRSPVSIPIPAVPIWIHYAWPLHSSCQQVEKWFDSLNQHVGRTLSRINSLGPPWHAY